MQDRPETMSPTWPLPRACISEVTQSLCAPSWPAAVQSDQVTPLLRNHRWLPGFTAQAPCSPWSLSSRWPLSPSGTTPAPCSPRHLTTEGSSSVKPSGWLGAPSVCPCSSRAPTSSAPVTLCCAELLPSLASYPALGHSAGTAFFSGWWLRRLSTNTWHQTGPQRMFVE